MLSRLQLRVVDIATRDAASGSCRKILPYFQALVSSVFAVAFGRRATPPLANGELEALRQYTCLSQQGDPAAAAIAVSLRDAGYSLAAIDDARRLAARNLQIAHSQM